LGLYSSEGESDGFRLEGFPLEKGIRTTASDLGMPGSRRELVTEGEDLVLCDLVPHHIRDIVEAEAEAEGLVELDPNIVRNDDDLVVALAVKVRRMGTF
jgi:hypothetical protein